MMSRRPDDFSIWGKKLLPHAAAEIGDHVGHENMKLEVYMPTVAHLARIFGSMETVIRTFHQYISNSNKELEQLKTSQFQMKKTASLKIPINDLLQIDNLSPPDSHEKILINDKQRQEWLEIFKFDNATLTAV
jgi:hypothetical protein